MWGLSPSSLSFLWHRLHLLRPLPRAFSRLEPPPLSALVLLWLVLLIEGGPVPVTSGSSAPSLDAGTSWVPMNGSGREGWRKNKDGSSVLQGVGWSHVFDCCMQPRLGWGRRLMCLAPQCSSVRAHSTASLSSFSTLAQDSL